MSIHRFVHTFPGGKTMTLTVDLSCVPAKMVATPMGLAVKHPDDYERWIKEVVTPALFAAADDDMRVWFAKAGLKHLP